jgi:SAM-dependent methyltransferase
LRGVKKSRTVMQTSLGIERGKIRAANRIDGSESVAADLLTDVLSEDGWMELLSTWWSAGCSSLNLSGPEGLSQGSWDRFHHRLAATGWFVVCGGRIRPNDDGCDLLARANELHRAILRDDGEDLVVAQAIEPLPRGAAVDIGCGPGYSVFTLAKMGFNPLFAYDLSPIAIGMAKALIEYEGTSAQLYAREATGLKEIDSESLSLVFSRGALHYFHQRALAKTLNRTLRTGGYLVTETYGIAYYLQAKHLKRLLTHRWRQPVSYARTVLRTFIYEALGLQLQLAAAAPEIGHTVHSIRRFARWAGLEVLSISPAASMVGYVVVMRKPGKYA